MYQFCIWLAESSSTTGIDAGTAMQGGSLAVVLSLFIWLITRALPKMQETFSENLNAITETFKQEVKEVRRDSNEQVNAANIRHAELQQQLIESLQAERDRKD